ncbi:hypothetical protein RFI_33201, partial [Reticulomyxa filosa]
KKKKEKKKKKLCTYKMCGLCQCLDVKGTVFEPKKWLMKGLFIWNWLIAVMVMISAVILTPSHAMSETSPWQYCISDNPVAFIVHAIIDGLFASMLCYMFVWRLLHTHRYSLDQVHGSTPNHSPQSSTAATSVGIGIGTGTGTGTRTASGSGAGVIPPLPGTTGGIVTDRPTVPRALSASVLAALEESERLRLVAVKTTVLAVVSVTSTLLGELLYALFAFGAWIFADIALHAVCLVLLYKLHDKWYYRLCLLCHWQLTKIVS